MHLLAVALLAACAAAAGAQQNPLPAAGDPPIVEAPATGPRVVAVELASDAPLPDAGELEQLIIIEVGEPLAEDAVRRTITNLYATGIAREIEVRTRPAPITADQGAAEGEGVIVTVALWSNELVSSVAIEGELGLKLRDLEAVLERGEGQPLVETRILRGVYALTDTYQRRGYFEAKVRVRIEHPSPRSAEVVYQVQSGPQAKVGQVVFTGDLAPFTSEELAARFGLKSGDLYRRKFLEESVEKLRASLFEDGLRAARVGAGEEQYDAETDRVSLTVPVTTGPRVETEITGAELKELNKKKLLPFLGADGYDEALVEQSVDRIRRYYQEKGYYRVEVSSDIEREPGLIRVRIAIVPGAEYKLTELTFEGNEQVRTKELTPLMTTSPKSLLALGSGRLVDETLAADLANLRAYYHLQGYAASEVAPAQIAEEGNELRVTIPIVEGPKETVGAIAVSGVDAERAERLERGIVRRGLLKEGGPFHPLLLEDAEQQVLSVYETRGYSLAQVATEQLWDPPHTLVDLDLRVVEGPQTRIDRIIVRGNTRTSGDLIRRVMKLEPEGPVSRVLLLDAQRNLYRLGIFSSVEVELASSEPGSTLRDVVARVEEGQTQRLVYGAGYDTDEGVRGLFGYSASNLFGRGYTLGLDLRLSGLGNDTQGSRFRLTFDQPYVSPLGLPVTYTLFYFDEARPSFNVERVGGRVEVVKEFGRNDRATLAYDFRSVKPDLDIGERLEDRKINISSLIPSVLLDARDDPVNPSRGTSFLAQLQYAFAAPLLDTDERFLKLFVQGTKLFPAGGSVIAASLRLGAIEPFRDQPIDPVLDPALPSSKVSIAERFFLGGATSHRAYALDQLGLLGETVLLAEGASEAKAVGGNGLGLINIDWRFPIAGALGGVVFVDAGNVWADWRDIDLAEARLGAGLGVRYLSPIGPAQLAIAFKLDRQDYEDDSFQIILSIGNPF